MRRMMKAAVGLLLLSGCGDMGGGEASTTVMTPSADGAFGLLSRTTNAGTTVYIGPLQSAGAQRTLEPNGAGVVQVATLSGQGAQTVQWSGPRAVAVCAQGLTIDGPSQVSVAGQPFSIGRQCGTTQAATPSGGTRPSAFGMPLTLPAAAPQGQASGGKPPGETGVAPPARPPMASPPPGPAPTGGAPTGNVLPARTPGQWRSTITFPGLPEQVEEDCLTPEEAVNWRPDPQEQQSCSRFDVRSEGGAVVAEATCTSPSGPMEMRMRATGDFQRAYEGTMEVSAQGPQGPVRLTGTVRSEYVGQCAAGQ